MNQSPKKDPKAVAKGFAIMAVIAIVIIFSLKSCFSSKEPESEDFKPTKVTALVISRDFVKQKLSAPASAKFDENVDGVVQLNNYVFMVSSHVDSQNSYGALIGCDYKCKITFDREGNAYCDEVVLLQ